MKMQLSSAARIYLVLMAITGWFALIGQFYININSKAASIAEIITRYFSFYTILTNILVAVCCVALLGKRESSFGKFFSRITTITAIAVNITIVGAVYNTILRFLWSPQGLQLAVDELLHLVIPIVFILFWLIFVPKGGLKGSNILPWTIYPLVYLAVVLVRGAFSGYYPYPFINVKSIGYPQTLINALGITVAFIVVALLFVGIDKIMNKKVS